MHWNNTRDSNTIHKSNNSSYKYTVDGGTFTKEQRDFYEENGYILIKNNVPDEILDEANQRFLDICNGVIDPGRIIVFRDRSLEKKGAKGEFLINKIQEWSHDEVLFKYVSAPSLISALSNILGPDITAVHSMFINKPPDSDPQASMHPIHQDLYYYPIRPANGMCTTWTALEKIDEHNGCLYVVPGSHKIGELLKHEYLNEFKQSLYLSPRGMDHLPKLYVPMDKGDTLFFHSLLLHGSGPNISKGFRKAISCHYANSNCHLIDVKGTVQESYEKEFEGVLKRRGYQFRTIHDFYMDKSRIVVGRNSKFENYDSKL